MRSPSIEKHHRGRGAVAKPPDRPVCQACSVPSPNVDLVPSIRAAWERGDYSATEWADPEIEFVIADGPSPGRWTGLVGMAEGLRDWLSAWEDFRGEAEEYRELDDERVLVLLHLRARGKTSGLEIGQMRTHGASLFRIRRAKVARIVTYWDRARALADLGLAPEGGSP
jgi:ketosteroid isomerase-like protein